MPTISVVIPVRDGIRHLDAAIQSILAQTFRDFELIIVDDGSQQPTAQLLSRLAATDGRIRLLRQAPLGIVAALNAGIAAARGEYIARMDADDIAAANRLEVQLAKMNAHTDVVVIGSMCTLIDVDGATIGELTYPCGPDEIRRELEKRNCIAHPSTMMRRRIVEAVGGYRPQFLKCEDYDLWLRIAEHHHLMNLPDTLVRYRMHAGQLSWSTHRQRIVSELAAQACSQLRRRGMLEPALPAKGTVDLDFLNRAGLCDKAIAEGITQRASGSAEDALRLGFTKSAIAAFLLAQKQPIKLLERIKMSKRFARSLLRRKR